MTAQDYIDSRSVPWIPCEDASSRGRCLGTTSERISDPSPTKTYLGQELHLTSAVTTSGGNHLSIIIRKDAVTSPGTFTVGLATDVQAGFTVPGSSGEVLFESGSVNLTAVNWSSGGQIAGTFSDLHRPADSLGVAPEARADGTLNISVP